MDAITMDKKYVTRDGKTVRVLCVDAPGEYSVIGLVSGWPEPACFTIVGTYWDSRVSHHCDLIEEVSAIVTYANLYQDGYHGLFSETPDGAQRAARWSSIGVVKITLKNNVPDFEFIPK